MIRGWYACDIGKVREENQDRHYFNNKRGIFAIADGMGGHSGGSIAARAAILALADAYPDGRVTEASIRLAADAAAKAVQEAAKTAGQAEANMGTTLVALAVQGDAAVVAHCGDSRCYRLRSGLFELLTKDHSVLQEAADRGASKQELDNMYFTHGGHITNALGRGYRGCTTQLVQLQLGDAFLLCSDGLNGMVSDGTIGGILSNWQVAGWQPNGGQWPDVADALVGAANAAGGKDNVTVGVAVIE